MAKKKRVRKPTDLSLAQLQQMVESKASELEDLRARRDDLQKQIDELDKLISETEGTGTKPKTRVSKKKATGGTKAPTATKARKKKKKAKAKKKSTRAQNAKSAKSHAIEILQSEPKGLTLKELADRILASGYKTKAQDFKTTLYQSLYNDRKAGKNFDYNDKTGNWVAR